MHRIKSPIARDFSAFVSLTLCAALACSCASAPSYSRSGAFHAQTSQVTVVKPVFLKSLFLPASHTAEQAYVENLFVGRIKFSGGIITDESLNGITRSKNAALSLTEEYEKLLIDAVLDSVSKAIFPATGDRALKTLDYPEGLLIVNRSPALGDPKYARVDNMNLPYWAYRFSVGTTTTNVPTRFLLVPIVECGYAHSAGWFYDQSSGCTAGIRVRVHLLIVDAETNAVAFSFFDDIRLIPGMESDLSLNEVYPLLIEASETLAKDLRRALK